MPELKTLSVTIDVDTAKATFYQKEVIAEEPMRIRGVNATVLTSRGLLDRDAHDVLVLVTPSGDVASLTDMQEEEEAWFTLGSRGASFTKVVDTTGTNIYEQSMRRDKEFLPEGYFWNVSKDERFYVYVYAYFAVSTKAFKLVLTIYYE